MIQFVHNSPAIIKIFHYQQFFFILSVLAKFIILSYPYTSLSGSLSSNNPFNINLNKKRNYHPYKDFVVFCLVIAWVRIGLLWVLVMVVLMMMSVVRMAMVSWVVMHWVEMMGWIVLARIKMSWRNRVIWMSATMLSAITIMPVIVLHIFPPFDIDIGYAIYGLTVYANAYMLPKKRPLQSTYKITLFPPIF